jgi:serine/threonine protein kinase
MDAFDVGAYLGRGGFATVYRAVERASGRTVALKVVDTRKLREAGVDRERLEREVALHSTCDHERIVRCEGSFRFTEERLGTEDDSVEDFEGVCLVLEYCSNSDLRQLLKRKGKLADEEAKTYLRGVLQGLEYLHSRNIVHRDVKLANVLLDDKHRTKLCDFGVAACTEEGERWTLCGTPNYVAPEIVNGDASHDTAVDLWSVGCLAHALLAGCPAPVQAKARAALGGKKRDVVDGDISPSLSPQAASFIRRLLRKDPADRPSASEALRDPFLCDAWRHSTDERWEAKASERLNVDCSDLEFEATTPRQTVCIRDGVARIAWLSARGTVTMEASDGRVRVAANGRDLYDATVDALPARFAALYGHLAKCITLVRSRTPRVVCRYGHVECTLMSNGPLGDVRLRWRDGCAARYSLATGCFELRLPNSQIHAYTPPSGNALPGDAPDLRVAAYLKDARSGVRKCLRAAARFAGEKSPIVVDVRAPRTPPRPTKKLIETSGRSTSSRATQPPVADLSFVSELTAATRVAG